MVALEIVSAGARRESTPEEDEDAARRWLALVGDVSADSRFMDYLMQGLKHILPDLLMVMVAGRGDMHLYIDNHQITDGAQKIHRKYR